MADLTIELRSQCLCRATSFKMVIPTDLEDPQPGQEMRTVFLLHGYTGKGDNWIQEDLIEKYHFAVVCPTGENGFWLNGLSTGHAWQSFVGEELVSFVRRTFGLAMHRESTYVCGLSMGGFGALHTALAYPEVFGKAIALSSALIHKEVAAMKPGQSNPVANYEYYRECFGEPEKLMASENAPETLVKKILASQGALPMPEIYMACGTEDFLLQPNREMHDFLESQSVAHTYLEWPGNHDMKFWHEGLRKFIPEVMA